MKKLYLGIVLGVVVLALAGVSSGRAQTAEWTLTVAAEPARVHLKPDASSPVAATLAKGTVLKSAVKAGAWFRVVVEAGRGGALVIGYVAAADVEIAQTAGEAPDLWEEAPEGYRGTGLSVRVGGGFLFFGSGDISSGTLGEFDRISSSLVASGANITLKKRTSVRSGADITGDIIYRLGSRTGLGIRFDYFRSYRESSLRYAFGSDVNEYTLDTKPFIDVYAIRPGFYYERPLTSRLRFLANGGPALYVVSYRFSRRFIVPGQEDDIRQEVKANRLGIQGGVGLELELNQRAGLYVEAQGRYARITGLKGTEWLYSWENFQSVNTSTDGFLYSAEKAGYPALSVLDEATAADANASRAVLDLSGISVTAGIRIRF